MGAALAELCLLGNKTQHSQVGYIGHGCGRLFEIKFRKLKLQTYQSISPAKVREKPPAKVENREYGVWGEGGRENSLHLLRMLHKRRERPHLAISISRMTETPPAKYLV